MSAIFAGSDQPSSTSGVGAKADIGAPPLTDLSIVHDLEFQAQPAALEGRVVGPARGDAVADRVDLEAAAGQFVDPGGPNLSFKPDHSSGA